MNVRSILRIGLLLIVAWFVLKIVFNLVGFVFHLLLIGRSAKYQVTSAR
jgi:hypothetical protein